jgi:DNA-binding transcriptional MerR regulator
MKGVLTIGGLAEATACKVQTVRYYEQIGLLPRPVRSAGNQRLYGPSDVDRLLFIRSARDLGFALGAIRELLGLADQPNRSCDAVDAIARTHLKDVERRLRRLLSLKAELERMIEQCVGGTVSDCRVIEALGEHANLVQRR